MPQDKIVKATSVMISDHLQFNLIKISCNFCHDMERMCAYIFRADTEI